LVGKVRHFSTDDVLFFARADGYTVHSLVVSVCKLTAQKFDMEKFYLKMLNDVEVKEQYPVKM
jgi:hypothetical protein